jgi:hypothetical protein
VADAGEDDVGGIALAALEMAAAEVTVGLHVSDHGLDGAAASQFALAPIKTRRGLAAQ